MELAKVIITIPKDKYQYIQDLEYGNTNYATTRMLYHAVKKGTPLDSVKAEIFDNIGNAESKDPNDMTRIFEGVTEIPKDLFKGWYTDELLEQIRKENNDNPEDIGCDHND